MNKFGQFLILFSCFLINAILPMKRELVDAESPDSKEQKKEIKYCSLEEKLKLKYL